MYVYSLYKSAVFILQTWNFTQEWTSFLGQDLEGMWRVASNGCEEPDRHREIEQWFEVSDGRLMMSFLLTLNFWITSVVLGCSMGRAYERPQSGIFACERCWEPVQKVQIQGLVYSGRVKKGCTKLTVCITHFSTRNSSFACIF
jgi:hypothetical protein